MKVDGRKIASTIMTEGPPRLPIVPSAFAIYMSGLLKEAEENLRDRETRKPHAMTIRRRGIAAGTTMGL